MSINWVTRCISWLLCVVLVTQPFFPSIVWATDYSSIQATVDRADAAADQAGRLTGEAEQLQKEAERLRAQAVSISNNADRQSEYLSLLDQAAQKDAQADAKLNEAKVKEQEAVRLYDEAEAATATLRQENNLAAVALARENAAKKSALNKQTSQYQSSASRNQDAAAKAAEAAAKAVKCQEWKQELERYMSSTFPWAVAGIVAAAVGIATAAAAWGGPIAMAIAATAMGITAWQLIDFLIGLRDDLQNKIDTECVPPPKQEPPPPVPTKYYPPSYQCPRDSLEDFPETCCEIANAENPLCQSIGNSPPVIGIYNTAVAVATISAVNLILKSIMELLGLLATQVKYFEDPLLKTSNATEGGEIPSKKTSGKSGSGSDSSGSDGSDSGSSFLSRLGLGGLFNSGDGKSSSGTTSEASNTSDSTELSADGSGAYATGGGNFRRSGGMGRADNSMTRETAGFSGVESRGLGSLGEDQGSKAEKPEAKPSESPQPDLFALLDPDSIFKQVSSRYKIITGQWKLEDIPK